MHGERTVGCTDTSGGSRILSLLVLQPVCCAEEHSRIKTTHCETQHNVGTDFCLYCYRISETGAHLSNSRFCTVGWTGRLNS